MTDEELLAFLSGAPAPQQQQSPVANPMPDDDLLRFLSVPLPKEDQSLIGRGFDLLNLGGTQTFANLGYGLPAAALETAVSGYDPTRPFDQTFSPMAETLKGWSESLRKKQKESVAAVASTMAPPEGYLEDIVTAIPGSIPALGAAAINPALGATVAFGQSYEGELNEAQSKGLEVQAGKATLSAGLQGLIEVAGGPELLTGSKAAQSLIKNVSKSKAGRIGAGIALGGLTEAPEEFTQSLIGSASQAAMGDKTITIPSALKKAGYEGLVALPIGGVLGGGVTVIQELKGQPPSGAPDLVVPEVAPSKDVSYLPRVTSEEILALAAARAARVAETSGGLFASAVDAISPTKPATTFVVDKGLAPETSDAGVVLEMVRGSESELVRMSINSALSEIEALERAQSVAGAVREGNTATRLAGQAKGQLTKLFNRVVRNAKTDVEGINAMADKVISAVSGRMAQWDGQGDPEAFVAEEVQRVASELKLEEKTLDELAAEDMKRGIERILLGFLRKGDSPKVVSGKASELRGVDVDVDRVNDIQDRRFEVVLGDVNKTDAINAADEIMDQAREEIERVRTSEAIGKLYEVLTIEQADAVAKEYGVGSTDALFRMSDVDLTRAERAISARAAQAQAILDELTLTSAVAKAEIASATGTTSRVAALRRQARLLEESGAAPAGYFDSVDAWYRREGYADTTLRPERYGEVLIDNESGREVLVAPTVEDRLSALKDVVEHVANKADERARVNYSKDLSTPKVPVGADGSKVSPDEYATAKAAKARGEAVALYESMLASEQAKALEEGREFGDAEAEAVLAKAADAIMRKFRVKDGDVKFRGDLTDIAGDPKREGLRWVNDHLPSRPSIYGPARVGLANLTDAQFKELVNEAVSDTSASKYAYDVLSVEAARRAAKEAPPTTPGSRQGPEAQKASTAEGVAIATADADAVVGGKKRGRATTWLGRKAESIVEMSWLLKWFDTVDPEIRPVLARGLSKKRTRDLLGVVIRGMGDAKSQAHVIVHDAITLNERFNSAIAEYRGRMEATGTERVKSRDEISKAMRKAYESGDYESIGDDKLALFLRDVFASAQNKLSETIKSYVTDPVLRRVIEDRMGRYVHNEYGAFFDPEAAFRQIDKKSPAYKRFSEKYRRDNYAKFKDDIAREQAHRLKDMSEDEQRQKIEGWVDEALTQMADATIVAHFSVPGTTVNVSKTHGVAPADYLKERVLQDEDLAEILGREDRLDVAAGLLAEKVGRTVESYLARRAVAQAFREAGLISFPGDPPNATHIKSFGDKPFSDDPGKITLDGESVTYRGTPEAIKVLNAIGESATGWEAVGNKLISFEKLMMLLSLGNWTSQKFGMPQSMWQAGGASAFLKSWVFSRKQRFQARLLAREMSAPGAAVRGETDRGGKYGKVTDKELKKAGLTRKVFDDSVREMLELGLGQPGEIAHQIKIAQQALFENSKISAGKMADLNAKLGKWYQLILRSDTTARAWIYQRMKEELTQKAGLQTPTTEIRKMAADLTMAQVQDPSTTPNFLKFLNRGLPGLIAFNFASFNWQVTRNVKNSTALALRDWTIAAQKATEGDARSAGIHAKYALSRSAGLTMSLYGMMAALKAMLFDDSEETDKFLRAIAYEDSKNADLFGGRVFGDDLITWGEDGRPKITYYQATSLNLNEPLVRVANASAEALRLINEREDNPLRFKKALGEIVTELYTQLQGTGVLVQAAADIFGQSAARSNVPWEWYDRKSIHDETPIPGAPEGVTFYGLWKAFQKVGLPAAVRPVVQAVQSQVEPLQDPYTNTDYENVPGNIFVRHTLGLRRQSADFGKSWNSAFAREWLKDSEYFSSLRKEYKNAFDPMEKARLVAQGEDRWSWTYDSFIDMMDAAAGKGFGPYDMQTYVFEDKNPATGRTYSALPKAVRNALAAGRVMTFSEYLESGE